jgi:NDP-sugar pyrophosphorylase family protein
MAAGLGRRLRPLTERWPKSVLPVDGRPVVVTLVHELAQAGADRIVAVTGHLAEDVETLLAPLPYRIEFVRQPEPLGSADAVRRAEATTPYLVAAADTVFASGDLGRFAASAAGAEGAIAVRRQSGRPEQTHVDVRSGLIARVNAPDAAGGWTAAPLWWVAERVDALVRRELRGPPFELAAAFQAAIDMGVRVSAIQVRRTRDLTTPVDLVRENFPYLR